MMREEESACVWQSPKYYRSAMFASWFVRFLLVCGFALASSQAASIVEGPSVESGAEGVAILRWRTDEPAGGRVRYTAVDGGPEQTATDAAIGTEHRVELKNLEPGKRYRYTVGTARRTMAEGTLTGPSLEPAKQSSSTVLSRAVEKIFSPVKAPTPAPAPAPVAAPPASVTWSNLATLEDHFQRHGADFRAANAEDYAALAWRFREKLVPAQVPMKLDGDGTLRAFDRKSGAFAAYNQAGRTKTYFKPGGADYFARQPGQPVQTPPWKR